MTIISTNVRLICVLIVLVTLVACGGGPARSSVHSADEASRVVEQARRRAMRSGAEVPLPINLDAVPARTLEQIAFEFSWDLQLPAPVHTSLIDQDVPDLMLVQLTTGEIHGIDARSGMTRFVTEPLADLLEFPIDVVRRKRIIRSRRLELSEFDDRFYCVVQSQLICFEAEHGHVIWRFDLPFEPSSGPLAEGGADNTRIFIGDWAGRIRVVSYDQESGMPFVIWQWPLDGAVPRAQAAGTENFVYVPDMHGRLSCFNLDRDLRWTFQAYGPLYAGPALRGRSLYIGANDNVLHVINRLTGVGLGSLYLDAPIRRRPMLFNNMPATVFLWTEGPEGGLHAVRAEPDRAPSERLDKRWFVPGLSRMVGSSPRQLYCMAEGSSQVVAIDKKSGNPDWRWDLLDTLGTRPAHVVSYVDEGDLLKSIYTIDAGGRMVSYRIFGQYTR